MKIELKDILKGKVAIIGIGNIMRGDDGFGPALIEELKGKVDYLCIDAGIAPENYTGKISKEAPDTIIFADAVHLEKDTGKYEVLVKEEIAKHGMTTHDISPSMLIEFLEKETKADIYLLGLQPKNTSFGDKMSTEVKKGVSEIAGLIKGVANA